MSINTKPIAEVPVIEELSEGDKLLVNSGGAAKQIDASKVGSGGGGGVIYTRVTSDQVEGTQIACQAYADAEMTTLLSYEECKSIIYGGGSIHLLLSTTDEGDIPSFVIPVMYMAVDEQKMIGALIVHMFLPQTIAFLLLACSDSVGFD